MDPTVLKQAYDRLIYNGLSPRVAVGVLGQLVNESGGSLNTGAVNPNDPGGSYGIAQWNRERLAGLRNFKSDAPDELSRQIDYVAHELNTTHRAVLERMQAARSAQEMTNQALGYEAPGGYTRDNPQGVPNYGARLTSTADIPGVLGLTGTAPNPTAPAQARNIDEFRQLMEARFPGINFTSGYRDPATNKAVGGAQGSQHLHNLAVDVALKNYTPEQQQAVYEYAREIGARGMGYYPNSQSAHFDLRTGAPAAWGPNYSKTSLGQTPDWYQKLAAEHLAGGTQVAGGGGGFWEGGTLSADGTAPSPVIKPDVGPGDPNVNPMVSFSQAFAKSKEAAEAKQQQVAQAAPPAPPPISAPPAPSMPDQGQAADLMTSLLARQRARYAPLEQPQGILDAWA